MKSLIIDRLFQNVIRLKAPCIVGLDPNLDLMPPHYAESVRNGSAGVDDAILDFNKEIVDHICDLVPAVKPQIAFYEKYGLGGLRAFMGTVSYAKSKGLIVIEDGKRNDIASSAEAYAIGHLSNDNVQQIEGFDVDFLTVNPYLGDDSLLPFVQIAEKCNKGLFVLVRTSNKSTISIQNMIIEQYNVPLYHKVAEMVSGLGQSLIGEFGYSSIGAVVGATHPEEGAKIRQDFRTVPFLVPGYGAQGGKAGDLRSYFDKDGLGALVSSSRGVIYAYRNEKYSDGGEANFGKAAREATIDMIKDLRAVCGY